MANYTTINKSTDYFNTVTYTGNGASNRAVTSGFATDFVWIKNRGTTDDHVLFDKIRTGTNYLYSNQTSAEATYSSQDVTFENTGVNVGSYQSINKNSGNIASWHWKANGAGSSNTDGSITSTVSANTTAGFSIVSYTGTGSSATVGHGLGSVPKMLIVKERDNANDWKVYHHSIGNNKTLRLDTTDAETSDTTTFASTTPTSSVFSVNSNATNRSGGGIIAYCFAEKTGYSKFGSYQGVANNDGAFVYTGFAPKFIMVKASTNTGTYSSWSMFDTARSVNENVGKTLYANKDYPEGNRGNGNSSTTSPAVDLLSNGFKFRKHADETNNSNTTYIYMAFGQSLIGSNNVPCTAR